MLGRNPSEPTLFQMVDVESLVPASHQLRKIDAVLDLSFVPEVVAECNSVRIPTEVATRFRSKWPGDSDRCGHPIPREVATPDGMS